MQYVIKLMECKFNLIQEIGVSLQCVDDALKALLEKHVQHMIETYNMLVGFQEGEALQNVICRQSSNGSEPPLLQHDDADIEIRYVTRMKELALAYAQAAVEIANPELRKFMEDNFIMVNQHAYEVWQYIMKQNIIVSEDVWKQAE
jgi:spore coat protein CotF